MSGLSLRRAAPAPVATPDLWPPVPFRCVGECLECDRETIYTVAEVLGASYVFSRPLLCTECGGMVVLTGRRVSGP